MKRPDRDTVINAFERCFCGQTEKCPGCYQGGPGFGFACRQALCDDTLSVIREMQEEIRIRRENDARKV